MNDELFEKRILFESLSKIIENQKNIMRRLGMTSYDYYEGYDDYDTVELVRQVDAIVNRIRELEKE